MTKLYSPEPIVVIGSQKSGTTTLMKDLLKCEGFEIDFSTKEESILLKLGEDSRHVDTVRQFFTPDNPNNRVVDVSTLYTKSPQIQVNIQAVTDALPNIKLIYIVRERLARALSHYQQDKLIGKTSLPVEKAITLESKYVTNSLYGKQLSIWNDHVDINNILLVKFEDYIAHRQETIDEICDFSGVNQEKIVSIDSSSAFNVTKRRPKFHPLIHRILSTEAYHKLVRKNLPNNTRDKIKRLFLVKNNTEVTTLSIEKKSELILHFKNDQEKLLQLHPNAPTWE